VEEIGNLVIMQNGERKETKIRKFSISWRESEAFAIANY